MPKTKKAPISTIEKLRKMNDDQLHRWFGRNARYLNCALGRGVAYSIRIGNAPKALLSDDTKELYDKFVAAVRKKQ